MNPTHTRCEPNTCHQSKTGSSVSIDAPGAALQVVLLGAGMDSRPWRLKGLPPNVTWFEVDVPDVTRAKASRLFLAGAQLDDGPAILPPLPGVPTTHTQVAFPLTVARWRAVTADLRTPAWVQALKRRGFVAQHPTVWVVEGVLYYLQEVRMACRRGGTMWLTMWLTTL